MEHPGFVDICAWLVMQWQMPVSGSRPPGLDSLHDQPCTNINQTWQAMFNHIDKMTMNLKWQKHYLPHVKMIWFPEMKQKSKHPLYPTLFNDRFTKYVSISRTFNLWFGGMYKYLLLLLEMTIHAQFFCTSNSDQLNCHCDWKGHWWHHSTHNQSEMSMEHEVWFVKI